MTDTNRSQIANRSKIFLHKDLSYKVVGSFYEVANKYGLGLTIHDVNQQRSYLKASQYEVAYLVNFGTSKIEIRRSIYTNDRKPFIIKLKLNS